MRWNLQRLFHFMKTALSALLAVFAAFIFAALVNGRRASEPLVPAGFEAEQADRIFLAQVESADAARRQQLANKTAEHESQLSKEVEGGSMPVRKAIAIAPPVAVVASRGAVPVAVAVAVRPEHSAIPAAVAAGPPERRAGAGGDARVGDAAVPGDLAKRIMPANAAEPEVRRAIAILPRRATIVINRGGGVLVSSASAR
jgi:hypothetical protein